MITFQVTPAPATDTEGVRFLFKFQPNGSEVVIAKESTTDLTWEGLNTWAQLNSAECGEYQADLITRESVERAFPGNPGFAITQYNQWINMPVGSVAPKNMGGVSSVILINNGLCAAQETTTTTVPAPTTTAPPIETTTTVPAGTTSTPSFQRVTETVPTTTPRTGTTLPTTGPATQPLPLAGVALILVALMLFAIAKRFQTR